MDLGLKVMLSGLVLLISGGVGCAFAADIDSDLLGVGSVGVSFIGVLLIISGMLVSIWS